MMASAACSEVVGMGAESILRLERDEGDERDNDDIDGNKALSVLLDNAEAFCMVGLTAGSRSSVARRCVSHKL